MAAVAVPDHSLGSEVLAEQSPELTAAEQLDQHQQHAVDAVVVAAVAEARLADDASGECQMV